MREGEILGLEWSQVDFLHSVIRLRAGETKNDEGREVPIVPQFRALVAQHARRQPGCDYVCLRFDRLGRAVQIRGFRKSWYTACIRVKLGQMVPVTDPESGETLDAKPRGDRRNPKAKPKMTYQGMIFHDLRRSGARALVHAGVPERVARSVFDRYSIVSPKDVTEAGRKLEAFRSQKVGYNSGTECTEMQQVNSVPS